jgi:1,4-alpha-glucan branching enzyme
VYIRHGEKEVDDIIIACNMTPIPRENYKIGLPRKGKVVEVFNSDKKEYFGSGEFGNKPKSSKKLSWHFREHSIEINISPLAMVAFKYQ